MAVVSTLGMESSVQSPYMKEALKRATMHLEVLESAKRLAAYTAVDHHILPEHTVSFTYLVLGILIVVELCRSLGLDLVCFQLRIRMLGLKSSV